jgi:hypothetical protein
MSKDNLEIKTNRCYNKIGRFAAAAALAGSVLNAGCRAWDPCATWRIAYRQRVISEAAQSETHEADLASVVNRRKALAQEMGLPSQTNPDLPDYEKLINKTSEAIEIKLGPAVNPEDTEAGGTTVPLSDLSYSIEQMQALYRELNRAIAEKSGFYSPEQRIHLEANEAAVSEKLMYYHLRIAADITTAKAEDQYFNYVAASFFALALGRRDIFDAAYNELNPMRKKHKGIVSGAGLDMIPVLYSGVEGKKGIYERAREIWEKDRELAGDYAKLAFAGILIAAGVSAASGGGSGVVGGGGPGTGGPGGF